MVKLHSPHVGTARNECGLTLTEILIVVFVLGIVASVTIPSLSVNEKAKVDLAAQMVADAIRFARSEAIRTGEVHQVGIKHDEERITVRMTDVSTSPVSSGAILYHPISKKLYQQFLDTEAATTGVEITNTANVFSYGSFGTKRRLLFDALGTPVWIDTVGGATHQLSAALITVGLGDYTRNITVDRITGRVRVQ